MLENEQRLDEAEDAERGVVVTSNARQPSTLIHPGRAALTTVTSAAAFVVRPQSG
jgi:hypothetical protein